MKIKYKYLLPFFGVLLFTISKGQNTFNNYYQSGKLSMANHIQVLPSNNYIFTAYFKDSITSQQGVEYRKLNDEGNTLLRKRYFNGTEGIGSFFRNCIVSELNVNSFIFTSGTNKGSDNTVYIAAIDKNTLDTLWTKNYGLIGNNYYMNSIYKVKPNEIWLIGTRASTIDVLRPIILKFDTLGNFLSSKEFLTYTNYDCLSIDFDIVNAKIYFAGNNFNTSPSGYNIACLDTSGNVLWNKNIVNDDLYFFNIKAIGNELICVGNKKVSNITTNGEHKVAYCKYKVTNGDLIQHKSYAGHFHQNSFSSFIKLSDNSMVFSGYYGVPPLTTGYKHDGLIFKVNQLGDSLWMRTFDNFTGYTGECFFDIKQTNDGGFIMCGAPLFAPTPQSQTWVVKTDSLGLAPGAITVGYNADDKINATNFDVLVYPNPFNNVFNVKSNANLNTEVVIKTIEGKLILQQTLNDFNTTINLNDYAQGIYFATFKTKAKQKTIKLIKN